MTTSVDIANSALIKLGQKTLIMSFDDPGIVPKLLRARYSSIRDSMLRAYRWSFSLERAILAASGDIPAYQYAYKYDMLPSMLAIIQIGEYYPGASLSDYNAMDDAPYHIEGRSILSNDSGPLKVRYVKRSEDPSLYDPCFSEALSCRIAMDLAVPVTDSAAKKKEARDEYMMAIREALKANSIELDPQTMADDSWILARL